MTDRALRWHEIPLSLLACVLATALLFHEVTLGGATVASAPHIKFTLPTGPVGIERPRAHPHADAAGPGWIHEANFPYRDAAWRAGEPPFWHPGEACGNPYLAGLLPGLFFPPNLLMHVGPPPLGFDLAYLARIALAGWLLYLFLRVHRLRRLAAATGGLLFLGSGYLLTSMNLANAAVECCIPGLLLGIECVIARRRFRDLLPATALVFCVLVGGNPQATFLALAMGGVYALVRLAAVGARRPGGGGPAEAGGWSAEAGGWPAARRALGRLILVHAAAGLLAAPQWLPFLDFLGRSAHLHHPGLGMVSQPWQVIPQWIVPDFYRNALARSIAGHHHYYLGAMPLVLAAASMGTREHRLLRRFALAGFLLTATWYFGLPGVRQLGALPGLSQIHLAKYLGPYLGLFAAVLAGLGVERLLGGRSVRRIARWIVTGAVGVAAIPALFTLLWMGGHLSGVASRHLRLGPDDPVTPTLTPTVFVLAGAVALAVVIHRRPKRAGIATVGLVLLAAAGVWLDRPGPWPPRADIYRPPAFLTAFEGDPRTYRVYSPDPVLTPNTASVFGLRDIRYAEALKLRSYAAWIAEAFDHPEAGNYFSVVGWRPPVPLRALSLLGVRYVLSHGELGTLGAPTVTAGTIRRWPLRPDGEAGRFTARLVPGARPVRARFFTTDDRDPKLAAAPPLAPGESRVVTLDAPPGVPGPVVVSLGLTSAGRGRATISEVTWCGRAVAPHPLIAAAYHPGASRVEAGRARLQSPNVIPVHAGDRPTGSPARLCLRVENTGSIPLQVGLVVSRAQSIGVVEAKAAHPVTVEVPPQVVPSGLVVAVDGEGHLERAALTPAALVETATFGAIRVSTNPGALPRAFGVHRAETAPDDAAARARVLNPAFDYARSVVIAPPPPAPPSLPDRAPKRTPRVVLLDESPGGARLEFRVAFDADGLFVLLDNHAPGWRATVDEAPAPILRVNGGFRAVPVTTGAHRVVLQYTPPGWRLGLWLAAAGLVGLLLLGLRGLWRGAAPAPTEPGLDDRRQDEHRDPAPA